MDASNPRSFDLLIHPFRILCVGPAATDGLVNDAFDRANLNGLGSDHALGRARAAILDPAKRLYCELSYPIDSRREEIEALYAALSRECSENELLSFSEQLAPLSRANLIAHLTARQPASGTLLTAFVESHASIDPARIYENSKVDQANRGTTGPLFDYRQPGPRRTSRCTYRGRDGAIWNHPRFARARTGMYRASTPTWRRLSC